MPSYDDDEDDIEPCAHCSCWHDDGTDCCDCGEPNDDFVGDPDDNDDDDAETTAPTFIEIEPFLVEDDGSEELKD